MKKIASPLTSAGQIDEHFGHCEFYAIYTISETNQIIDVQTIKAEAGCGCKSNIAGWLKSQNVTLMLAGGIGGGAIDVLNSAGIEVIRGCSGSLNDVVKQYLAGLVLDSGESCKEHEEHHKENVEHFCKH